VQQGLTEYLDEALPPGERERFEQHLAGWGVITALAHPDGLLAVTAAGRTGVFELRDGGLGRCLWQAELPYYLQWLGFSGDRLLAAGYDAAAEDPDGDNWEAVSGGGLISLALDGGDRLLDMALPPSIAWGYGANPIVLADKGSLYAIDRYAGLHFVDTAGGELRQLCAPQSNASLAIGHCELRGGSLYAGFSRGDYVVYRYGLGK
jgi:hypothetical protein